METGCSCSTRVPLLLPPISPQSMAQRRTGSSQPSESTSWSPPNNVSSQHASVTPKRLAPAPMQLVTLSLVMRILSVTLLIATSHLQQAFDTSHELLSYTLDPHTSHSLSAGSFNWTLAFVRWDTIYFLASASPYHASSTGSVHQGGYAWEQTLAFQPGIIGLLRLTGYLTPTMDGSWSPTAAILVTMLLANVAAAASVVLLYRLSLRVTRNAELAYTAALLSIVAPSAGTTLASPTPESFYSLASLVGLLYLETNSIHGCGWGTVAITSFWFAVATAFRANGALLVGYVAFKLIGEARCGRVISAALKLAASTAVCMSANVLFQVWAYGRFCLDEQTKRPWCARCVPSVYTFVQSQYWDVGLFRYWHASQLPNFALGAPVLALIAYTAYTFYCRSSWSKLARSLIGSACNGDAGKTTRDTGLMLATTPRAVPYIVHGGVLGAMLLFASHVQIALRLATPGGMPMLWWGAAHAVLYCKRSWLSRALVGYLCVQYCVGIVLYAGFYPPA